ncbi:MAG: DUF5663 domain-containing protein [Patescibacteria group bacterium]|jgi:hypothetical protein
MDSIINNTQEQKDIFTDLGLTDLPDEEKGAILAKMIEVIQTRTLLRVADALTPEKQEEMKKLGEGEDTEAMEKFLTDNAPNMTELFEEETKKLRQEMIDKMNQGGSI